MWTVLLALYFFFLLTPYDKDEALQNRRGEEREEEPGYYPLGPGWRENPIVLFSPRKHYNIPPTVRIKGLIVTDPRARPGYPRLCAWCLNLPDIYWQICLCIVTRSASLFRKILSLLGNMSFLNTEHLAMLLTPMCLLWDCMWCDQN